MNVCGSQSLRRATSVRGEARQTAAKPGAATCADASHAECGGRHSRQSPQAQRALAPAVSQAQPPPNGFPPIHTVWPGGKGDSGSTRCSPGITAPGWCLQTQSNTATATSSAHQLLPKIVPFWRQLYVPLPLRWLILALTLCDHACH